MLTNHVPENFFKSENFQFYIYRYPTSQKSIFLYCVIFFNEITRKVHTIENQIFVQVLTLSLILSPQQIKYTKIIFQRKSTTFHPSVQIYYYFVLKALTFCIQNVNNVLRVGASKKHFAVKYTYSSIHFFFSLSLQPICENVCSFTIIHMVHC